MMVGRDGAFGILMSAAVGMFFLVPAHGLAQDSLSVSCADVNVRSPLSDVLLCGLREQAFAQHILGLWYDTGNYGVPEDDIEAVRWYRFAAEQGWVNAQYNLGLMYADGEGVPEDDEEAVWWYRLAAEQGYASAQTILGLMYANGEGVPEDLVLAYMWYNLSAAQGNPRARSACALGQDNSRAADDWRTNRRCPKAVPRVDRDTSPGRLKLRAPLSPNR